MVTDAGVFGTDGQVKAYVANGTGPGRLEANQRASFLMVAAEICELAGMSARVVSDSRKDNPTPLGHHSGTIRSSGST